MLVLLDLDGVLSDLEAAFVARLVERHPEAAGAVPDLAAERTEPRLINLLPRQLRDRAHALMDTPGLFAELPLVAGARAGVAALRAAGVDLAVCTSPRLGNPTCASDKFAWVASHFGPELAAATVVTKDKTLVAGDYLIDDWPRQVGRAAPTWQQIVFDQPYNRHVDASMRLHGWADLPRLLERLTATR